MKKTAVAVALGAALAVGSIGGATAAPRVTASLSFFEYGGSSAGWITEADGNKAVALSVEVFGFAGIAVNHVAGQAVADVSAPSFDFLGSDAGSSGGSPRLVVNLSNDGQIHVHPTADILANTGGNCPNAWGLDWAAVVACNPGATVTSAFVVADLPGTVLVDNVQWDGKTFGSAADNRR